MTGRSRQSNTEDTQCRRVSLRIRGTESYSFHPIGDVLHRAWFGVLAEVDPRITANGRNDRISGSLSVNGSAVDRFLREKNSRRQDYSQRQNSLTHEIGRNAISARPKLQTLRHREYSGKDAVNEEANDDCDNDDDYRRDQG